MPANRAKPESACARSLTNRTLTEPPWRDEAKPRCIKAGVSPLIRGARARALLFVLTGARPRLCESIVRQTYFSRKSQNRPAGRPSEAGALAGHRASARTPVPTGFGSRRQDIVR